MRLTTLVAMTMVAMLLLVPSVMARKGVGILWTTEGEIVTEGEQTCITYGLYNPWEEDVTAQLTLSESLHAIVTNAYSEPKLIRAGTSHENAIPVQLCFKTANIYTSCNQAPISIEGKVGATEVSTTTVSTTGSTTALGVSVPLTLKVTCNPDKLNYLPLVLVGAGLLVAGFAVYRMKRKAA